MSPGVIIGCSWGYYRSQFRTVIIGRSLAKVIIGRSLSYYWSGGTEEVTSRYRILLHARPRSGIGGGRGPGEILLRAYVRGHKLL